MARTPAPPQTDFAARLRQARDHAELTQVQVCETLGISQGTLSGLEIAAERSIYVVPLARLYGVDPTWLYSGEGEMVPTRRGALQKPSRSHASST
jgi:transcriptional regulator with XRE-family HTH domain